MDIPAILRSLGFRATRSRVQLLAYMEQLKKPASIQAIARGLRRRMDPVTVYRIIESFTQAGLVREIDLRQGRPLYEIADTEHDHHHVVCTDCGKIADFTGCEYERFIETALSQIRGFSRIESHALELFGVCNACARS